MFIMYFVGLVGFVCLLVLGFMAYDSWRFSPKKKESEHIDPLCAAVKEVHHEALAADIETKIAETMAREVAKDIEYDLFPTPQQKADIYQVTETSKRYRKAKSKKPAAKKTPKSKKKASKK